MKSTRSARLLAVLSLLPVGLLALANAAHAQKALHDEEDPRIEEPRPFFSVVLEGIVLGPDGAPSVGAVVLTSAGGKAVTDQDGAYRLEVEVTLEAESAQVTAVATAAGGGSLTASTSVGLFASRLARVAPLVLAASTTCQPSWLPTFGGFPGVAGTVSSLAAFDDGSGPALYAGGSFSFVQGKPIRFIARWDGSSWSALGSEINGVVSALTVFDDGGGPALYAGGGFTTAGAVAANRIAKWNGSSWSALGSGMNNNVQALTVFDDGSGAALYAGGHFTTAGGVAANRIAKWDGSSWSALSSGMSNTVNVLTIFDDGSGSKLYAAGNFVIAGGVTVNRVARWNGSSWSALGAGLPGEVRDLKVFDDGSGPTLYAGGDFDSATVHKVAKWDGSSWSALGSGMNTIVYALTVFDDGSGPALHAGGYFTTAGGVAANRIAKWNGSTWSALGSGMSGGTTPYVFALTVFDDGGGPALYAGGDFTTAGDVAATSIARWDGSTWSALGSGLNSTIMALTTFDDGSGPALYAGGYFITAGGVAASRIAKWNGSSWSTLGSGMNNAVLALTAFDDGSGPALYAGGYFTTAGGVAANRIARWDGSTWSALSTGVGGVGSCALPPCSLGVNALAVFDDGAGPALYAGGIFTVAGGVPATYVAKWDGSSWSAVGGGVSRPVYALTVFDDGTGPALYAGGEFRNTGTVPAERIAKWNGSSWSALGSGMTGSMDFVQVDALAVHDDGSGPALYAGGNFSTAGGVPASRIARWDGSSWSALGSGMASGSSFASVYDLAVFDDGSGPALYAGGPFGTAGGVTVNCIAKWNGSSWSALGSGTLSSVSCLAAFEDGNSPALFVGGSFASALDSGDSYLAEWGCDTTPPTIDCPVSVLARESLIGPAGEVVTFEVSATDVHDEEPDVVCVPPSGSFFPRGTTLVTCTATDDAGNVSTCVFPVTVRTKVHRPEKTPRGE